MAIKKDGHFVTFGQHIQMTQAAHPDATGQFSWLLSAITLATKMIASYVRRAGLIDVWGEAGGENVQGETVQRLDILANDTLKRCLGYRGNVGIIASEEDNDPRVLQEAHRGDSYIVMFDPLDGSSNIDVNVSVGTIFTIFKNPPDVVSTEDSVLQPGVQQVAAGYVLYGSSTVLVYSDGDSVDAFTLDPAAGARFRPLDLKDAKGDVSSVDWTSIQPRNIYVIHQRAFGKKATADQWIQLGRLLLTIADDKASPLAERALREALNVEDLPMRVFDGNEVIAARQGIRIMTDSHDAVRKFNDAWSHMTNFTAWEIDEAGVSITYSSQ